jgi:hypothetical protein
MSSGYRKATFAEYEACYLLREQGWYVTRCYGEQSPPDLFAVRRGESLLVMVRFTRHPVPDAKAVSLLYQDDLARLRTIGNPDLIHKECWIRGPPDGWKFYEVSPAGIRRIRSGGGLSPVVPDQEDQYQRSGVLQSDRRDRERPGTGNIPGLRDSPKVNSHA